VVLSSDRDCDLEMRFSGSNFDCGTEN
jgi:hypothetical protein